MRTKESDLAKVATAGAAIAVGLPHRGSVARCQEKTGHPRNALLHFRMKHFPSPGRRSESHPALEERGERRDAAQWSQRGGRDNSIAPQPKPRR